MTTRNFNQPYNPTQMVDKQIGDVYPTVRLVAEHLQYIVYLAANLDKLAPRDVEIRNDPVSEQIQWRYVEDGAEWINLISVDEIAGPAVEMQAAAQYLEYRPVGSTTWRRLLPIADITGKTAEMRQESNVIQWRLIGDTQWSSLLDLSTTINNSATAIATAQEANASAILTASQLSAVQNRQDALENAQQSNALYFATKAEMDAVTGTSDQGAFVTGGADAGQYKWNGTQWVFLRADGLPSKLDKSEYAKTILQGVGRSTVLAAIADSRGRGTWLQANAEDGGPTPDSVKLLARAVPGLPESDHDYQDVLAAITDRNGFSTWLQANKVDGGPTKFAIDHIRRALNQNNQGTGIVCEGDSMTASSYDGGLTYPAKLAILLGRSVVNVGISGTTAAEISLRAGGLIPLITIPGGIIPATTAPIAVSWNITGAMSGGSQPVRVYSGKIRGIPVNLNYTPSTGSLTLSRKIAGNAVALSTPVAFEMDTPYLKNHVHILWAGRNDYPKSGAYDSIAAHIARMEKVQAPYLVIGVCNSQSESSGSAGYNEIIELNSRIQKRSPLEYVDIRGRLIREGLTITGLTPTPEDMTAIAADRIPPQLMYDNLHLNTKGRDAAAAIVADELTYRGLLQ
ncbi:hypothetical protein C121_89 [Stenotrophomonas phage C121]|uniref:tail fiber protein n=1 Tax=Stenotrophomonas phage C121 TaxID=2914029 RepID=UPI0023294CF7|nr:tail fiber protein [Stenotrophomonas phage C121]UKL14822.1 hypothetical protein C121_89 [Stenotrophomonas phage C121]